MPSRLEAMALAASGAALDVVRRLIGGGIGAVVHLERGPAGRRVAELAELVADDGGQAIAVPLRTTGMLPGLSATGRVPRWADRLDPSVRHLFESATPAGRVRVLEAAERWGAPPAEALAARAEALRTRARLRADAEAGRAAVRLAFPLVLCFLPAFVSSPWCPRWRGRSAR